MREMGDNAMGGPRRLADEDGAGWHTVVATTGRGRGRMRRGDIRTAVLAVLSEEPGHGYDVIQRLEDKTEGSWRPSPGSVYPMLQLLADEGLARSVERDGKRVYELTDAGRAETQQRIEDCRRHAVGSGEPVRLELRPAARQRAAAAHGRSPGGGVGPARAGRARGRASCATRASSSTASSPRTDAPATRAIVVVSDSQFGVYVHIPFCATRCDYCDFATWTDRAHLIDDYVDACVRDIERQRACPPPTSVFFGGGTPSLLDAAQLTAHPRRDPARRRRRGHGRVQPRLGRRRRSSTRTARPG